MKKIMMLCLSVLISPVFGAEPAPELRLFVYPDVLEYAINKHFSVMDRDRAAQEYENRMNQSDGTVTKDDIRAVCKAGRIDDTECNEFQKDITTYFYDVCEKNASKGKSDCIKDFWAAIHGSWVRLPEAIGIAKEYASVKNKEKIVCSTNVRNVNPPARASYVKCTSVDGTHYYEYKYNSTTETNDRDILSGTLRAVGKIHDIDFDNADCSLERIYSDSNCALSYKTSDNTQCEKINKSLKRFGYSSKVVNTDKFGKRCEVYLGANTGNRTAYGIDNTVFKDVQVAYTPDIEQRIRTYVQNELKRQNIPLKSFSCNASTTHVYSNSNKTGFTNSHDEILTCYVNDQPIDFIFDDLSEEKGVTKNSGLSKMACAQVGGKIDGRDCRGLDKDECISLSAKIPGGTRWDSKAEACILNKADIEKKVNDRIQILGGLVLAVGLAEAGASTVFVLVSGVGSVLYDSAFITVERLNELQPKKRAYAFVSDALECKIPVSDDNKCDLTQVECATNVINKHAARIDEIFDNLNDSQLKSVAEAMWNTKKCLSDGEFFKASLTSTLNWGDKLLNAAPTILLCAGVFVAPENVFPKLLKRAPRLEQVFLRVKMVFGSSSTALNNAKHFRIFVDKLENGRIVSILDQASIDDMVKEIRKEGYHVSSNISSDNRRFIAFSQDPIFEEWNHAKSNWLNLTDNAANTAAKTEKIRAAQSRGDLGYHGTDAKITDFIQPSKNTSGALGSVGYGIAQDFDTAQEYAIRRLIERQNTGIDLHVYIDGKVLVIESNRTLNLSNKTCYVYTTAKESYIPWEKLQGSSGRSFYSAKMPKSVEVLDTKALNLDDLVRQGLVRIVQPSGLKNRVKNLLQIEDSRLVTWQGARINYQEYIRVYVNGLSMDDIHRMENRLRRDGLFVSSGVAYHEGPFDGQFIAVADKDILRPLHNTDDWLRDPVDAVSEYMAKKLNLDHNRVISWYGRKLNRKYVRIYVDGLSETEIRRIETSLKNDNMFVSSGIDYDNNKKFIATSDEDILKPLDGVDNWLKSAIDTLRDNVKNMLVLPDYRIVTWSGQRLGKKYVRIYVDGLSDAEIRRIESILKNNKLFVSSGIDYNSGKRFIATSDSDIFAPWANSSDNWLKNFGTGNSSGSGNSANGGQGANGGNAGGAGVHSSSGISDDALKHFKTKDKTYNFEMGLVESERNINDKWVLKKWGLAENSIEDVIKKRFRELSNKFHPDHNLDSNFTNEASKLFSSLNIEKDVLYKAKGIK